MKLDYLKDKKELVSIVLLGVSGFLGVCILVKVTGLFVTSARAERLVREAVKQSEPDAKQMEKYFAESRAVADELKKKNLFAPPAPKQQPIKQVLGILGDEVLIEGKWYRFGDMVGDAKIVAIKPAEIVIEWDGREIALAPIDAVTASPPRKPGQVEADEGAPRPEVDRRAAMGQSGPGGMPGRGAMGGFFNLSPEQRAGLRERFESMSEEERARVRDAMRARFGGGQSGGRGSGDGRRPGGGRR